MFSEYYFYLIAYSSEGEYDDPTIFRKRIQFMYQGKLTKVKFEYYGMSIEHILDRLPTAKIKQIADNKYLFKQKFMGKE